MMQEKIANLLSNAEKAKDKKDYTEAISLIDEANKLKETKEISLAYESIMNDLIAEAEATYFNNDFEKSSNLYLLLKEYETSSELKDDYQVIIHQIQYLQLVQEEYELEDFDFNEDSLFNELINGNEENNYNANIVDEVKSYVMNTEQEEIIQFIFDINIEDLSNGGE